MTNAPGTSRPKCGGQFAEATRSGHAPRNASRNQPGDHRFGICCGSGGRTHGRPDVGPITHERSWPIRPRGSADRRILPCDSGVFPRLGLGTLAQPQSGLPIRASSRRTAPCSGNGTAAQPPTMIAAGSDSLPLTNPTIRHNRRVLGTHNPRHHRRIRNRGMRSTSSPPAVEASPSVAAQPSCHNVDPHGQDPTGRSAAG